MREENKCLKREGNKKKEREMKTVKIKREGKEKKEKRKINQKREK